MMSSLPNNVQALGFSAWPKVSDTNGVELPYFTANDVDAISTTMGEFPWTLILRKSSSLAADDPTPGKSTLYI